MGKNKDIKYLIKILSNTIVHEIVARHTNRPESKEFLKKEVIEYMLQTEKVFSLHTWNKYDKEYIKKEIIIEVNKIMLSSYPDVFFEKREIEDLVNEDIAKLEL